jgi:hypothetical protein
MSISRRKFLSSSAVLSALVLLKPGSMVLGHTPANRIIAGSMPVQHFNRSMFEPHLGETFRVLVGKQTVNLKLAAITDVNPRSTGITIKRTARTDGFSLQFEASKPLPATIHTLDHQTIGSFRLFTTQSEKGSRFLHTAILNHFV